MTKTDSGMPNNTHLNNFDIFNEVLKFFFEIKNFEIENVIGTLTPKKGYFKLTVKNNYLGLVYLRVAKVTYTLNIII